MRHRQLKGRHSPPHYSVLLFITPIIIMYHNYHLPIAVRVPIISNISSLSYGVRIGPSRTFAVSKFRCFADSLFRIALSLFRIALSLLPIGLSLFRSLVVSHRPSAVSYFRCFVLSLFRTFLVSYFVISHFRCFVLSLFRTFVVSYFRCFILSLFRNK